MNVQTGRINVLAARVAHTTLLPVIYADVSIRHGRPLFTENAVRSQLPSADCVGERKLLDEDRIDVLPIGSDKLFDQQTIGHLDSQHDQYDRWQSAKIDAVSAPAVASASDLHGQVMSEDRSAQTRPTHSLDKRL